MPGAEGAPFVEGLEAREEVVFVVEVRWEEGGAMRRDWEGD